MFASLWCPHLAVKKNLKGFPGLSGEARSISLYSSPPQQYTHKKVETFSVRELFIVFFYLQCGNSLECGK